MTTDAIVHIAVNMILLVVWAVRLEMKVKSISENFKECKTQRETRLLVTQATDHEMRQKLDTLLQQVARIEGQLAALIRRNGIDHKGE